MLVTNGRRERCATSTTVGCSTAREVVLECYLINDSRNTPSLLSLFPARHERANSLYFTYPIHSCQLYVSLSILSLKTLSTDIVTFHIINHP